MALLWEEFLERYRKASDFKMVFNATALKQVYDAFVFGGPYEVKNRELREEIAKLEQQVSKLTHPGRLPTYECASCLPVKAAEQKAQTRLEEALQKNEDRERKVIQLQTRLREAHEALKKRPDAFTLFARRELSLDGLRKLKKVVKRRIKELEGASTADAEQDE